MTTPPVDTASQQLGQAIAQLAATVAQRADADPDTSYTAFLLNAGSEHCARKIGEEAVELILALVSGRHSDIGAEAADLCYHLLVGMRAAGVGPKALTEALNARRGVSGFAEKADRT